MLKLSKISKVILITGMLTAFSCVNNVWAQKGSYSSVFGEEENNYTKEDYSTGAHLGINQEDTPSISSKQEKDKLPKSGSLTTQVTSTSTDTGITSNYSDYYAKNTSYNQQVKNKKDALTKDLENLDTILKEKDAKVTAVAKEIAATGCNKLLNKVKRECVALKQQLEAAEAEKDNIEQKKTQTIEEMQAFTVENKGALEEIYNVERRSADAKKSLLGNCVDATTCSAADLDSVNEKVSQACSDASSDNCKAAKQMQKEAVNDFAKSQCLQNKDQMQKYQKLSNEEKKNYIPPQPKYDNNCLNAIRRGEYDYDMATGQSTKSKTYEPRKTLKSTQATYNAGEGDARGIVDIDSNGGGRDITGAGGDYRSEHFRYDHEDGDDVLEIVTRRAALAVVGLKPIVYVFAGFGLIAFAWMAIFNKISWKWFANIVMGLFLVANMGRFIEYFVAGDGVDHYYIGQWENGATPYGKKTDKHNQLANAFRDIYYVYGDVYQPEQLTRAKPEVETELKLRDTGDNAQFNWSYTPTAAKEKFCGNAFGSWKNFSSCVKDVVDTAKAAKATVQDIGARIEDTKEKVENIKAIAKSMEGGSVTDMITGSMAILNNVNGIASTAGGALSATSKNFGGITGIDTSGLQNVSNYMEDLASAGNKATKHLTEDLGQAKSLTNAIENTSVKELLGEGTTEWFGIDDKHADKTLSDFYGNDKKAWDSAQASKDYKNSDAKVDSLQKEQNRVNSDLNDIAKKEKQYGCDKDNTSAVCKSLSASKTDLEKRKSSLGGEIAKAENEAKAKYSEYVSNQLKNANDDYEKAQKDADKVCKKNSNSFECVSARKQATEAAEKVAELQSEKDNPSYKTDEEKQKARDKKTYDYNQSKTEQKNAYNKEQENKKNEQALLKQLEENKKAEDKATALKEKENVARKEYTESVDAANELYNKVNTQEAEVKDLEKQHEEKKKKANDVCKSNESSSVCQTARQAAQHASDALDNKKEQLAETKSQYKDAKTKADTAYGNYVDAGKTQAENDLKNSQNKVKEAEKTIKEAQSEIFSAKSDYDSAKTSYNQAVVEAEAAKKAYETSPDDEELKAAYNDSLSKLGEEKEKYDNASAAYKDAQNKLDTAKSERDNAVQQSKNASEKLAGYTDEKVNKTNENRINTNEDTYNQYLVDKYQTETNPNALAKASKNAYSSQQDKTEISRRQMEEAAATEQRARQAYEEALAIAQKSGKEEDMKKAERLRSNYELAQNEAATAAKEYKDNSEDLAKYEADYISKAKASEEYKQKVYASQMQQYSTEMNEYEQMVAKYRKEVEKAGDDYMKAKNKASNGDSEALQKAATEYQEYKDIKAVYDDYVKKLNQANANYKAAEKGYQDAVAELERLKAMR